MPLNGFHEIWEELKVLNEEKLNELADFKRGTTDGEENFQIHYEAHGKPLGLTEEQYEEYADALTSYPAIPIGTGQDYDVYGYIAQNNKRVKFVKLANGAALGVYVGNPITGRAISYYHENNFNQVLFRANPFRRLTLTAEDLRYKSDLDGRFEGLKAFKPITNPNSNIGITQEEYRQIRSDIYKRRKISIERWKLIMALE